MRLSVSVKHIVTPLLGANPCFIVVHQIAVAWSMGERQQDDVDDDDDGGSITTIMYMPLPYWLCMYIRAGTFLARPDLAYQKQRLLVSEILVDRYEAYKKGIGKVKTKTKIIKKYLNKILCVLNFSPLFLHLHQNHQLADDDHEHCPDLMMAQQTGQKEANLFLNFGIWATKKPKSVKNSSWILPLLSFAFFVY